MEIPKTSTGLIQLTNNEAPLLKALLAKANLMYEDIDLNEHYFFGEFIDDHLVATAGLEVYESHVLIRSVAVDDNSKGKGLGMHIVKEVEAWAKARGIKGIYLLTESAEGFFIKNNYHQISRAVVPDLIAQTTQFAQLCPQTAICMHKSLNS